jgi:hypothetical protein
LNRFCNSAFMERNAITFRQDRSFSNRSKSGHRGCAKIISSPNIIMREYLLKFRVAGPAFSAPSCSLHGNTGTLSWVGGSGDWSMPAQIQTSRRAGLTTVQMHPPIPPPMLLSTVSHQKKLPCPCSTPRTPHHFCQLSERTCTMRSSPISVFSPHALPRQPMSLLSHGVIVFSSVSA